MWAEHMLCARGCAGAELQEHGRSPQGTGGQPINKMTKSVLLVSEEELTGCKSDTAR